MQKAFNDNLENLKKQLDEEMMEKEMKRYEVMSLK